MTSTQLFWVLFIITQVCGLATYGLIQSWLGRYNGGFDWGSQDSSNLIQNFHALFMTIGFMLLFGEATLMYRLLSRSSASYFQQKVVHATILLVGTVIWVVGLIASLKARSLDKAQGLDVTHFYSFHSWIGFLLLMIFLCQFCFALVWHTTARYIPLRYQRTYQKIHVFNGLFLFILSTVTCLTGLNELAIFKVEGYSSVSSSGIHLNFVGLAILGFATTVIYILWKPEFKLTPPVGEPKNNAEDTENNLQPNDIAFIVGSQL